MAILDQLVPTGPDLFYDPSFRNVLEDHMTYLRQNYCSPFVLTPALSYQWRGDFFGLLDNLGVNKVPRQYHWLVMRLNEYTSPNQFTEDTLAILLPDYTVVQRIAQSHQSVSRIS